MSFVLNIYDLINRVNKGASTIEYSVQWIIFMCIIIWLPPLIKWKQLLKPPHWAYKGNCTYQGRWLINHFVVIITVLVYNFKLRAAYFILIILLCSPSRSTFRPEHGVKKDERKRGGHRFYFRCSAATTCTCSRAEFRDPAARAASIYCGHPEGAFIFISIMGHRDICARALVKNVPSLFRHY